MKRNLIAISIVSVAALSACGGGSDDTASTPAPSTSAPGSANQSPGGFIAYVKSLVASASDAFEPVDVSTVTAPADDTGEPVAVD